MFPRRPKPDDSRWREVAVRARTQPQAEIKRLPVDSSSGTLAIVYLGDTISIIPEIQHEFWIAAKVGYHVGWINTRAVKLISLRSRTERFLEETKPHDPVRITDTFPAHNSDRDAESETQPAPPVQLALKPRQRRTSPLGRSDINRIINHLKGLGGLFRKSSANEDENAEA